jgi:diacylglycerol kinase (ATP)
LFTSLAINDFIFIQVDGEAWLQPPGFIYLTHKNRAQMLTRNKVFEHSLKIWSEKQKDPHLNSALTKEEFAALQSIVDDAATLIKRYYKLKVNN